MFETEDGIFDTSGYDAEQEKDFFTMYPNAKRVGGGGGGEEVIDDYSYSDTYSSYTPEVSMDPEDSMDPLLAEAKGYEEFKEQKYTPYREKGANRKPEGAADATYFGAEEKSKEWRQPWEIEKLTAHGQQYIANQEIELEDGSKIYLTLKEMLDPKLNPNLKKKEDEANNEFFLSDGTVNKATFKHYREPYATYSETHTLDNFAQVEYRTVKPYELDIKQNGDKLRDLGSGSKHIPEQYRYWEGENPPEEFVMGYTAYTLQQRAIQKARTSEYDKAVATLTPGEQKATEKQVEIEEQKAEEFLETDGIKNLIPRMEAFQNDPRNIENKNIESRYAYGEELTPDEIKTYEKNRVDLETWRSSLYEDYENLDYNIGVLTDTNLELDLLKRDYNHLNKLGFIASDAFAGLATGLAEYAATAHLLVPPNIAAYPRNVDTLVLEYGQQRREASEKASQMYRPNIEFDDAFDDWDKFGRFITEESARQLPIFAIIAASGGAASALGAGEMGAALVSGTIMGTMSAGQQIGDMTRQEFLSKYNDIQAYGKNLEYNDKEYSDLNKFMTGTGFGAAEGLLGVAPTYLLGSRFLKNGIRAARATEQALGKRLTSNVLQKALNFGKPLGKAFVLGSAEEAVTEGLTTLTQNVITRNPNVFEGVGHATFSGGFFGGIIGGGAVSMGVAMNASMNPKGRLELQNLYDKREKIKTELQYKGLSPEIKKRLENSITDLNAKIDDKTLEVEEMWLSKMSRKNFNQYTEVLGKQADLKQQYLEATNKDSGLTEQQKKEKVAELVEKYQANHNMIEKFRNPLDYANRWHLLESIDKKRYDRIKRQASKKILDQGFEVTEAKVKKEAYDIYLLEEILANGKNAKNALKNVGLKFKGFEFKTEKEAKDFANKKIKELNIDPNDIGKKDNFWVGLSKAPIGALNGQAGKVGDTYVYVTTEENQLKNEREGTATHEVGHLIFWDWIETQGLNIELVAKEITQFLKETNPKIYSEMFGELGTQTVERNEAGNLIPEEIIMGFIERIGRIDKNKKVSKTFMYRLGQIFNKDVGVPTDLSTQPAIVSFISSLAEKIKDGTLTREDIKAAESSESFKGLLPKGKVADAKVNPETKKSLSLLENINNLVPKDVKTKEDFQGRKVFNPVFNATQPGGVIYNYVNSRAVSREEANITLERVVDRLINYDPAAVRKTDNGDPITFGEFIFANTRFSKLDAKKRLAIESATRTESIDTEEARQVANPEPEQTSEAPRVEYKNLVESKVLPAEMVAKVRDKIVLVTKTLKSRIDAATSINKTVTPLMSEIKKEIGKQADIEFKKMLGAKKGGELETNYLKLKQPILENMTTTWLMQGMPFAIQKSVDGKFTSDWEGKKIDRESVGTDKAGRTAGAQLVRRLPNAASKITNEQFLTYMFDSKGGVIRGRKEALAKAMAEEYTFDIYREQLLEPESEIRKAFVDNQVRLGVEIADNTIREFNRQAERGNVKRSFSKMSPVEFLQYDVKSEPIARALFGIDRKKLTLPNIRRVINSNLRFTDIRPQIIEEIAMTYANGLASYRKSDPEVIKDFKSFKDHLVNIASQTDQLLGIKEITGASDNISNLFDNDSNIYIAREANLEIIQRLVDEYGVEGLQMVFTHGKNTFSSSGAIGNKNPRYFNAVSRLLELFNRNRGGLDIYSGALDFQNELLKQLKIRNKFETSDGVKDISKYSSEKRKAFFKKYTKAKAIDSDSDITIESLKNTEKLRNGKKEYTLIEIKLSNGEALQKKYTKPPTSVTKKMVTGEYKNNEADIEAAQIFVNEYFKNLAKQDLDADTKAILLATFNDGTSNALRSAVRVWGKSTVMPYALLNKYRFEHAIPARVMLAYLYEYHVNGNKDVDIDALWKDYRATIIPITEMDEVLTDAGFSKMVTADYVPGQTPWWKRSYNIFTMGKMPYAMVSYDGKEIVGERWQEYFNEKNKVSLDIEALEKADKNEKLHKAQVAASKRSYSENPKGISVWDFDDTLAATKSNVLYTVPNTEGGFSEASTKLKAIFMVGGPGAGKTNVANGLQLGKRGYKVVNQDIALEAMKSEAGLPANESDYNAEQRSTRSKLGAAARKAAIAKFDKYAANGNGMVVDGTGASYAATTKKIKALEDAGYEVHMVVAMTPLKTAMERNKARVERSLPAFIVKKTYNQVQESLVKYRQDFGDRLYEINTESIEYGKALPADFLQEVHAGINKNNVGKLDATQFAAESGSLEAKGAKFDFREFSQVKNGEKGPMFDKAMARNKKFGNENVFILTARPANSSDAIHKFLKGIGLDIRLENITGLADGSAKAKADWMIGKVADGYNDFYFADDAIKNVKAVSEVLETFDVKSKVQQAIAKRKSSMSSDLNKMIERNKGVKAEATFSKVLARKKGAKKGKFKFFVPYSAEDFRGLTSYTLAGKGRQGEIDQDLFEKSLIIPYTRGIAAMEGSAQALKNDYRNLLKMFDLKKELGKKIGDTSFTTDQAIRVYLWTQEGVEVPNISKRDQKKLNGLVSNNPDLVGFAEGLMAVSKKDNWVNPKEHWDVGSILKDLNEITEKINRKEHLAEFIENVDEMFDPTTLNKLEAVYGTTYVEALNDSIRRMKSGSNRPAGVGKIEQKWLNWVNNSVGTIMFFNRRSAALQMLSFTNFINWSDNNPLKAAQAFANQPLYWKTWTKIFNSDKLKERRGGLKSDIQESEIANQARNSEDKAAAVLSYILKQGFKPTQIADSFAIATGGATFLINRTKKYESQGLSKEDAAAKAFEDFSLKSDETQQSGDPMLISQQQSSHLGRLVLAFQNTPMQYTRLIKKASKDLINGRGSTVENVSKIAYYGFVQNLVFSALQSALFAMLPGFDDEEEEEGELDKKTMRTVNSMIDTLLRGSGLAGAVVSTIKNAIIRYQAENEKGFTADHTYTVLELANVSPPIGSKLRKVYSAIQTEKYNRDVIDYMGYHVLLNGKLNTSPKYEIIANIASAGLNIPADRLLAEIKSINEALDSRNTAYQRAALALGWKTYDVNVKNEEQDLIKAYFKAEKKEASKEKAKANREAKKIEEEDRIKAMSPQERIQYNNEQYRKRSAAGRKAAETRRKNIANR